MSAALRNVNPVDLAFRRLDDQSQQKHSPASPTSPPSPRSPELHLSTPAPRAAPRRLEPSSPFNVGDSAAAAAAGTQRAAEVSVSGGSGAMFGLTPTSPTGDTVMSDTARASFNDTMIVRSIRDVVLEDRARGDGDDEVLYSSNSGGGEGGDDDDEVVVGGSGQFTPREREPTNDSFSEDWGAGSSGRITPAHSRSGGQDLTAAAFGPALHSGSRSPDDDDGVGPRAFPLPPPPLGAAAAALQVPLSVHSPLLPPPPSRKPGHQRQETMTPSAAMVEKERERQEALIKAAMEANLRRRYSGNIKLNRSSGGEGQRHAPAQLLTIATNVPELQGSSADFARQISSSSFATLDVSGDAEETELRELSAPRIFSISTHQSPLSADNLRQLDDETVSSLRSSRSRRSGGRAWLYVPELGGDEEHDTVNGADDSDGVSSKLGKREKKKKGEHRRSPASRSSDARSISPVSTTSTQSSYYVHKTVVREDPRLNRFEVDEIDVMEGDVVLFEWTNVHNIIQVADSESTEPLAAPASDDRERRRRRSGFPTAFGHFTVPFPTAGVYHFCSETNPDMRVCVRVSERPNPQSVRALLCRIVAFIVFAAALLATAAAFTVLWSRNDRFFVDLGSGDPAIEPIKEAFLQGAYGWYVLGLIVLVVFLIAAVVNKIRFRRMSNYGRGFEANVHSLASLGTLVLFLVLLCAGLALWAVTLRVSGGFGRVAGRLSESIIMAINDVVRTLQHLEFLKGNLPLLIPGYKMPQSSSVDEILGQVSDISVTVKVYSATGENIFRGVVRILNVMQFLSLQFLLLAGGSGIIGSLQRKPHLVRLATWLSVLCIALFSISIGTTTLLHDVMKLTHGAAVSFEEGSFSVDSILTNATVEKDSPIVTVLSLCSEDRNRVGFGFIQEAMSQAVDALNDQLRNRTELGDLRNIEGPAIAKLTVDQLVNYTDYLSSQLDAIDGLLTRNDSKTELLNASAIPAARALIAAQKSILRIIDCTMLRQVLGSAIPIIRDDVLVSMRVQLRFKYIIFAALVLISIAGTAAAIVLSRPRKTYTDARTKRWFLFPYSLRIHQRIVKRTLKRTDKLPSNLWRYPSCTVHNVLASVADISNVNSVAVMFQAALLLILHLSKSGGNRISGLLIAAAVLCFCAPMFTIPINITHRKTLQVVLRFLSIFVTAVIVGITVIFATLNIADAINCIDSVVARRGAISKTVTVEEIEQDECSADRISSRLEISIYAIFIAIVVTAAFFSALVLLVCCHRVVRVRFVVPGVAAARRVYRKLARLFSTRGGMILIVAVSACIVLGGVLALLVPLGLEAPPSNELRCNGFAAYCNRRVNELAWGASHNSMSSSEDKFVAANHYFNVSYQLRHGARVLMLDVWNFSGSPFLCHKFCELGRTPLGDVVGEVFSFLAANPREVVMIIFEQYFPTSGIVAQFERQADRLSTDMLNLAWVPPRVGSNPDVDAAFLWPTLGELIAAGKRLLIFNDERQGSPLNPNPPQWFMFVFAFMYETPFSVQSPAGLLQCRIGRGQANNSASMDRKMSIMNHFVTVGGPIPSMAAQVNDPQVILARGRRCMSEWNANETTATIVGGAIDGNATSTTTTVILKRMPNVVAVDFWSLGNTAEGVRLLNEYAQSSVFVRR